MSNTTEDTTQGQVLLAVVANSGLETAVAGYLSSLEHVLTHVVEAAEQMVEDGLSLADFAVLLRGGDL